MLIWQIGVCVCVSGVPLVCLKRLACVGLLVALVHISDTIALLLLSRIVRITSQSIKLVDCKAVDILDMLDSQSNVHCSLQFVDLP